MDDINEELELYKLVTDNDGPISECGWVNDTDFFIWLYTFTLSDFTKRLAEIFGDCLFDEGGIEAHLTGSTHICIDLTNALSGYDVDFERVFPKDKFEH